MDNLVEDLDSTVDDAILDEELSDTEGEGSSEEKSELEAMQQRLHDTQAKLTEVSQDNAGMRGKLSVLDSPKEAEVFDPLESYTEDSLLEDPLSIVAGIREVNNNTVVEVADVMRTIRNELLGKIESLDPARAAMKSEIDALKADPELASLDDKTLMIIAKRSKRDTTSSVSEPDRPAGVPGGRSVSTAGSPKSIKSSSLFKEIYGNSFEPSKK